MSSRVTLFTRIGDELDRAYAKHGAAQWGRHEFYAILKEEVDELWDAIKGDEPQERVLAELIQVAAMCFRYYETGDRYAANDPGPIPTEPQVNEPRPSDKKTSCITREDVALLVRVLGHHSGVPQ